LLLPDNDAIASAAASWAQALNELYNVPPIFRDRAKPWKDLEGHPMVMGLDDQERLGTHCNLPPRHRPAVEVALGAKLEYDDVGLV
jgi:hypothetical protein